MLENNLHYFMEGKKYKNLFNMSGEVHAEVYSSCLLTWGSGVFH